jgi:MinD-like ATPase involved in chromosome partitioning or flagellar assembly
MAAARFVVLGLAAVRAGWFADMARWATSATLPVDFTKVVSAEEARARLRSGRAFSALLVGTGAGALDRDLVEIAVAHGCAVVAVDDGRSPGAWSSLGVDAVVGDDLTPEVLLDTLTAVARPVARHDDLAVPDEQAPGDAASGPWRGRLVAVTGAGGVGRSTLAAALATGLAGDPRDRGLVVLADLALHAHQAVAHDAGDVVPALLELVEAHRRGDLRPHEVRDLTFAVPDRGYDLLLGLRRHRDWTALRPRAVAAALDALVRSYRHVVVDVDADVEGEAQCGSLDVEDRNALARRSVLAADLVLVVGVPGVVGLHAQLRVLADLIEHGVAPTRLLPVVNRAGRSARGRAETAAALAHLLDAAVPGAVLAASPVFVPERRRLAETVRDAAPPPGQIVAPLAGAVRGLLDRSEGAGVTATPAPPGPVPVRPGTLGSWTETGTGS